jgi:hypothetical protein
MLTSAAQEGAMSKEPDEERTFFAKDVVFINVKGLKVESELLNATQAAEKALDAMRRDDSSWRRLILRGMFGFPDHADYWTAVFTILTRSTTWRRKANQETYLRAAVLKEVRSIRAGQKREGLLPRAVGGRAIERIAAPRAERPDAVLMRRERDRRRARLYAEVTLSAPPEIRRVLSLVMGGGRNRGVACELASPTRFELVLPP